MTTPTDPTDHPPMTLDDVSDYLVTALRDLADDYGPTGVLHAVYLIWPDLDPSLAPVPSDPYRALDPDTSNAAGKRHRSDDVGRFSARSQQGQMLGLIAREPMTAYAAAMAVLEARGLHNPTVSQIEGCRRRMSDLVRAGYVEDSGDRENNPGSPDPSIVWKVTDLDGSRALVRLIDTGWTKPRTNKESTDAAA